MQTTSHRHTSSLAEELNINRASRKSRSLGLPENNRPMPADDKQMFHQEFVELYLSPPSACLSHFSNFNLIWLSFPLTQLPFFHLLIIPLYPSWLMSPKGAIAVPKRPKV